MNKTIVTVCFVVLTISSMLYFKFKGLSNKLKEHTVLENSEPRIVLEDFGIYNYEGAEINSFFSAKLANFVEPNRIEMFTSVRVMRYSDGEEQSLRSGAAFVVLDTKDITSVLKTSQRVNITKIDFESDVRVVYGEDILKTDTATYYYADTTLSSTSPMVIEGRNRIVSSDNGFRYNLNSGILSISNFVKGTVVP